MSNKTISGKSFSGITGIFPKFVLIFYTGHGQISPVNV